jgi:hypothetical protein
MMTEEGVTETRDGELLERLIVVGDGTGAGIVTLPVLPEPTRMDGLGTCMPSLPLLMSKELLTTGGIFAEVACNR